MRFSVIRAATAASLGVILFCGMTYAQPGTPEESVRAALEQQNAWLGEDANAAQWREFLLNAQLDTQLSRGDGAEPTAVAAVLARYKSGALGLELPPFRDVRQAVGAWLMQLPLPPRDQLPAAARGAKAVFLPYTQEDVSLARTRLMEAVARLDARLKSAEPRGADWANYLKLDQLQQQLAQPAPDLTALDAAFQRFAAGYEGLQLVVFSDVRKALRRYLTTVRAMGQPQIRQQYQTALENLAKSLEAYLKDPSYAARQEINVTLEWLDQAGQAPWLAQAIRKQLSLPNLYLQVSKDLVASRVAGPVNDTSPFTDCILGTNIYGNARITGQVSVEFVPSEDRAVMDLLFQGTINSDSVGYNGPVTIFGVGNTPIGARKRLVLDAEQLSGLPTASSAVQEFTICDIQARHQLIENLAWRRAGKQKGEADYIAARHAEQRFSERMDQRADSMLSKANQGMLQKLRGPLTERGLFPDRFQLSTAPDALQLLIQDEGAGHLAAPAAPPQAGPTDLVLRVHESAINNLTAAALGGVRLDEKRFQEIVTQFFGLPQQIETAKDEEEWSITFPERQPVVVNFVNGGFSVTIRGRQYMNQGREYPGMNVTAVYRIEKTDQGLRAVRQGRLQIFPPGYVPESGQQLSGREQVLRNVLESRFGQFFTEVLAPKNVVIDGQGRSPAELALSQWDANNGWLVMAWKQVPLSAAPAGNRTASAR